MNTGVMLLIDADNVSVDVMEQAVELMIEHHGALHVRRAYCTAESALKHQTTFKRLGIKPMVNLAAGKNSTDIAMAVDAIDLVLALRPAVVAIASSDSDFAPLVQRLREKGCRVVGIGQDGKTGDETISVYDEFTVLAHRRGGVAKAPARGRGARASNRREPPAPPPRRAPAPVAPVVAATQPVAEPEPVEVPVAEAAPAVEPPAPERAPRRRRGRRDAELPAEVPAAAEAPAPEPEPEVPAPAAAPEPAPEAPAAEAPAPRRAPRRRKTAEPVAEPAQAPEPARPAPAPAAAYPDEIRQILAALPELLRGDAIELRLAAERLRDADLLGPRASSTRFFAPHAERFELLPAGQPNKVRLRPIEG